MSKLISQGGYGCIYHPGFDPKDNSVLNEETVVKLQHKSSVSVNEIQVSKLIKSIPNFTFYFAPILKTEPIEIGEIEKKLIKSCKPITRNLEREFVLMTIPYIDEENYFESIENIHLDDTRSVFTQYIDSYTFLLTSIELLIQNKIIHFDLKDGNIVYNRINKNPILIDFGISFSVDKLSESTWDKVFYVFAPEYYIWCLEIHFISFLVNENDTLEQEDVEMICTDYVNSCPVYNFFSPDFKDRYIKSAIKHYMQYVELKKEKIILSLLETWDTWDNYSLSILNLRVISYLFSNQYYKNNTISYLIEIYLQNIHYDGRQRLSIEETKRKYKKLYNQDSNVDNLSYLLEYIKPERKVIKKRIKDEKLDRSSIVN